MASRECCVSRCTSRDCKTSNFSNNKISFHKFPSEEKLRKAWIAAIYGDGGNNLVIGDRNVVVCSKHFSESDLRPSLSRRRELLKPGAVPKIFPHSTEEGCGQKRKLLGTTETESSESSQTAGTESDAATQPDTDAPLGQLYKHRGMKKLDVKLWQQDHDYSARNYAGFTPEERLEVAAHYISKLQQRVLNLQVQRFCLERFSTDPELISFYTGFSSYQVVHAAFLAFQPTAERLTRCSTKQCHRDVTPVIHQPFCHENLALIDQFFLFLVKLKQGLTEQDLAYRFAVSLSCVRRVIHIWANYLYSILREMPIWASRSQVDSGLSASFRLLFPRTRVIVHTAVLRVEKPTDLETDGVMATPPDGISTCKGLLGISPAGAVSCISNLNPTPISNKELAVRSRISQLLDPGDQVMVKEHFPIEKELRKVGASLAILPTHLKSQSLNLPYFERKQCVESLQSHVRRAIQRVGEYYIFDNVIPCTIANQLWTVCCLLTNFKGPLR